VFSHQTMNDKMDSDDDDVQEVWYDVFVAGESGVRNTKILFNDAAPHKTVLRLFVCLTHDL
jgi:hypothetical protein